MIDLWSVVTIDNKGMVYGVAVFLTCLFFGIVVYIGLYYVFETVYNEVFPILNLSVQGSASLSVLIATWASVPAIIFFASAWWLINHVHRRQTV